jgi:hypothetical protein
MPLVLQTACAGLNPSIFVHFSIRPPVKAAFRFGLLVWLQRSGNPGVRPEIPVGTRPGSLPQGEKVMRKLNTILLALTVGAGSLLTAPLVHADKYETHNYYGGSRHGGGHHNRHHGRHKVVNVYYAPPVHERVVVVERPVYYQEPVRYYREETAYYPPPAYGGYRSATPMIVGGIIGGVLGNQVGKGRGNDVATVAGVILGGSIGRDMGYYHQ